MKKSKRIWSLFLALILTISVLGVGCLNSYAIENSNPTTIAVTSKEAKLGDTVEIDVSISNNVGVLGAILSLKYDEALTLTDAKEGTAFSMLSMTKPGAYESPCKFSWDGVELTPSDIKNGNILTLVFEVNEKASVGKTYKVELSYNQGEIIDSNLSAVAVSINNGSIKVVEDVPQHKHNYLSTKTNPTCTEQGYTTYICSTCNDTYKADYVTALGHNTVIDKAVKATCTVTGLTEGKHCDRCKIVLVNQELIDKTAHTPTTVKEIPATCETDGKTEGQVCSVCNTVISGCEMIEATGHVYVTKTTRASTSNNGSKVTRCVICEKQAAKSTIYYPKTITLSATKYTYDGKVKKPTVKVVDANGKTIAASNYTVTYSSGLKNVGKYTVKIAFKDDYYGTVSKTFTIVPKSTTISSLTATSKGFTVKWKKQATQTTGYQVRYSTKSNMTSANTVTVSKNSTVSKKITKLTAKKKYYVQVRTYKTVNGTKYYSAWSGSKSVTTKK